MLLLRNLLSDWLLWLTFFHSLLFQLSWCPAGSLLATSYLFFLLGVNSCICEFIMPFISSRKFSSNISPQARVTFFYTFSLSLPYLFTSCSYLPSLYLFVLNLCNFPQFSTSQIWICLQITGNRVEWQLLIQQVTSRWHPRVCLSNKLSGLMMDELWVQAPYIGERLSGSLISTQLCLIGC